MNVHFHVNNVNEVKKLQLKLQNYRIVWIRRDPLKIIQFKLPDMGKDTF